jgi:predicted secreted acid phosphatase
MTAVSRIHPEARCWWLTPVILATQDAEIRRIQVQSQPMANMSEDPILKIPSKKKG